MNILDQEIVKKVKNNKREISIDDISDDDPIIDGSEFNKPNHFYKMGALTAIKKKKRDFYDTLGDVFKRDKNFKESSYVLLKWLSTVGDPDWQTWKENGKKGKPPIKENNFTRLYLQLTNEIVNKYFWDLTSHPRLQFYLMCALGEKGVNFNWLDVNSSKEKNKLNDIILNVFNDINSTELNIIRNSLDTKEKVIDFCKRCACDDKVIKDVLKEEGL